jgi:SAM-dependent methyltransferase
MRSAPAKTDLQRIYERRFRGKDRLSTKGLEDAGSVLRQMGPENGSVLDLGAGYCEFTSNVQPKVKYAMDLNPSLPGRAGPEVTVIAGDCAAPWPLPGVHLDAVFTSNFLEHLHDKAAVSRLLTEAHRHLKPGGAFVAMGPTLNTCQAPTGTFSTTM